MKNLLLVLVLVFFNGVLNAVNLENIDIKINNYALIIANDNYKFFDKLPKTKNELNETKKQLTKRGFQIVTRINLDKKNFKIAVESFIKTFARKENSLLYIVYLGHTHNIKGDNYIIPLGVRKPTNKHIKEFYRDSISFKELKEITKKHTLFISDSCKTGLKFTTNLNSEDLIVTESEMNFSTLFQKILSGNDISKKNDNKKNNNNLAIYTLIVNSIPDDAEIDIINKDILYYSGIELLQDRYIIRVQKDGFITKRVELELQEDTILDISLEKINIAKQADNTLKNLKLLYLKFKKSINSSLDIKNSNSNLLPVTILILIIIVIISVFVSIFLKILKKRKKEKDIIIDVEEDEEVYIKKRKHFDLPSIDIDSNKKFIPEPQPINNISDDNDEKKIISSTDSAISLEDKVSAWIDKETNLMWEIKNEENISYRYVWSPLNVDGAAFPNTLTDDIKDIFSYVKKLNRDNYAGFNDWRLPTKDELKTLLSQRKTLAKGLNDERFYTKEALAKNTDWEYWTISQSSSTEVWSIKFNYKQIEAIDKHNSNYVRCVRYIKDDDNITLNNE